MYLLFIIGVITLTVLVSYVAFSPTKDEHKKKPSERVGSMQSYKHASGNGYLATMRDRGNHGEFIIFQTLSKLDVYSRILVNIYVPKENGEYSEVDLAMITNTGIYVIESKNYSGWIFGNESQKNWTQLLHKNSKFPFYNPIWQNKGHISALDKFLELNKGSDAFKSYIVFGNKAALKKITLNSDNIHVIKSANLLSTIRKDIKNYPEILSDIEVDEIASLLENHVRVSEDVKLTHIESAKKAKSAYSSKPKPSKQLKQTKKTKPIKVVKECPRCKSKLTLRIAKRGENKGNQFYGCSNYPKCRYIENIDN